MKIVCDACQAKYSISDDKVRGKAFKIRCKKCSNIIVVRSTGAVDIAAVAEVAAAAPAPTGAIGTTWHVVIDGEQVGPLSDSDVKSRVARGEINGDTYVWRDGLADWLKLADVPELAGGGRHETPDPFARAPAAVYLPGTTESVMPGGGAPREPTDVFAAPTAIGSMGADLFASAANAPAPADTSAAPSSFSFGAPSPGEPASPRLGSLGNGAAAAGAGLGGLTGQRHENSVLFSLSNLEALAQPSAPVASPAPRPSVGGTTEGSGLIDIRSMAAVTLGRGDEPHRGGDLPAFDVPQFSPVAPVLLPINTHSGPPRWLYALLVVLVLVASGLGIATYKVFTAAPAPVATAPAPVPEPVAAAPAPKPVAPAAAEAPPATPPPPANEALPPREEPKQASAQRKPERSSRTSRSSRDSRRTNSRSGAGSAPVAAAPTRAPEPEKLAGKRDKLDDLLDSALGTNKSRPAPRADEEAAPRPAPSASLPTLGRQDIVKAMNGVKGKVKDCYDRYKVPGTAMVNVSVAQGGRVSGTSVTGKFAGTPTGSCVESAVKSAKFPPSQAMNFPYPFPLN